MKIVIAEFENIKGNLKSDLPYDIALQECKAAKENALSVGNPDAAGHASKGLAECYRRVGQIDNAIQEYKTAIQFFKRQKNLAGIAWTKWGTANIFKTAV